MSVGELKLQVDMNYRYMYCTSQGIAMVQVEYTRTC